MIAHAAKQQLVQLSINRTKIDVIRIGVVLGTIHWRYLLRISSIN